MERAVAPGLVLQGTECEICGAPGPGGHDIYLVQAIAVHRIIGIHSI